MEDILASIRRILNEDEPASPSVEAAPSRTTSPPPRSEPSPPPGADDVLVLDASMMVNQPQTPEPMSQSTPPKPQAPAPAPAATTAKPAQPAPAQPDPSSSTLVAPEAAAGVASSLGSLVRTLSSERGTAVHRDGPTIEDLVREEIRPLVKEWLDRHLPPIVERLVRIEIERVVGRAVP